MTQIIQIEKSATLGCPRCCCTLILNDGAGTCDSYRCAKCGDIVSPTSMVEITLALNAVHLVDMAEVPTHVLRTEIEARDDD